MVAKETSLRGSPIRSALIRGTLIILFAAFVWGIGNAVTGLTAQKYRSSGSLFPAVEIALANTLGGLLFLIITYVIRNAFLVSAAPSMDGDRSPHFWLRYLNQQSLFSGALKGANTCLFVFSTTYIAATQSLVLESTYIVWSLFLSVLFLTRKIPFFSTAVKALLLFLGVILVSGQTSLQFGREFEIVGSIFGICAGLSYASYLFFWSFITRDLDNLKSQLAATSLLLLISSLTITSLTEVISVVFLGVGWVPFSNLQFTDLVLQTINGAFVVGLVYLLVTIGMANLKNAREGATFTAAFCLSFSIPFTLLPELVVGKFVPAGSQLLGICLFMVAFVLMSISLSQTQQGAQAKERDVDASPHVLPKSN